MAHAVGIGYDWIHDYLDEETRERIRSVIVELGLKPGIERHQSQYKHFTYAYNCLLYTSPSPRDQRGSRMPSSA